MESYRTTEMEQINESEQINKSERRMKMRVKKFLLEEYEDSLWNIN